MAVKYDKRVVDSLHMDEEAFHNHLAGLNDTMEQLMNITETLLSKWDHKTAAMQLDVNVLIKDNEQLRNLRTFPLKTAATLAALG